MNRFASLVLVSLVFFLITSCCSFINGNNPQDYYFLRKDLVEGFLPNRTDSIIFENSTGIKSIFNKMEFFDDLVKEGDCVECCDEYEVRKLTYDSPLGGFKLKFEINRDNNSEYFNINHLTKNAIGIYYFGEDYFIAEKLFLTKLVNKTEESVSFQAQLDINSKSFSNIYIFTTSVNTNKLYVSEIYYSATLGMVGYKISDGTIWSLVI